MMKTVAPEKAIRSGYHWICSLERKTPVNRKSGLTNMDELQQSAESVFLVRALNS